MRSILRHFTWYIIITPVQTKHCVIPFWGGAISSQLNSLRSIQATRLPLGTVNFLECTLFLHSPLLLVIILPTNRGMEGWVNSQPGSVGNKYWTWDLSHNGPLLYQLSYLTCINHRINTANVIQDITNKDYISDHNLIEWEFQINYNNDKYICYSAMRNHTCEHSFFMCLTIEAISILTICLPMQFA